ncbi:MAG TPA: alpha-amylase family glycosyl hydrolase [Bryobacteraceae bacterium]|nr:alpha-amylase family glycosyl hydrolase [Bryobacteraceae bacterium]
MLLLALLAAASPLVTSVEPPEWWAGHSLNPVRLLIRGQNLVGASVQAADLKTTNIRASADGRSLFVDVEIAGKLRPGSRPLRIRTAGGATTAPFHILPGLNPQGRFQGFSSRDVMYLIMPDRFSNGDVRNDGSAATAFHGGDLQGILDRLPYLKELGVTALWLNPIYDNTDADYHGYGPVNFYAVDEHFGTVDLFRALVDEAHRHGIRIIQDQVANHSGPMHPWVRHPPTPSWFHDRDSKSKSDAWFLGILPDLNQDDPEVERYLIQNALWWIGRTGIDGIRQDTVPYVPSSFWRKWNGAVKRQYPELRVIGEIFDRDPRVVNAHWRQGGFDTAFDFPLYYAIRDVFLREKPKSVLQELLALDAIYPHPREMVTHLGLHDVARFRDKGSWQQARDAFTYLFSVRGVPLIYYGDEIGMQGGEDPDNRRDFPQRAFNALGRMPEEQDLFTHVQTLIRKRLQNVPSTPTTPARDSKRRTPLRPRPD